MNNFDNELSIPSRAEAMNLMENAMCYNPRESPFGMFLRDAIGCSVFLWYDTEESLLDAIEQEVFALFPDDGEDEDMQIRAALKAIIDSVPSQPKIGEELRNKVDEYIKGGWCMEWMGTFKQACEGSGEWESEVRQQFRENMVDDWVDMSDDELMRPITTEEEVSKFAKFIVNKGSF